MEIGDVLDNRYQLVQPLQTAWLAINRRDGQHCLVRRAADFIDPAVAAWLEQVRHPGLPQLLNRVQDEDEQHYYVFEYLPGTPLGELAAKNDGRIPASQLLPIISQAARILDFLHRQSDTPLLHLDIKPDHILIDQCGQVSLIDFGAARTLRSATDDGGVSERIALTPDYAAPELLYGHPCPGSDIYALGLTLLQMLTGLPPASCRSLPLASLLPALPARLQGLIGRCLQSDPSGRYALADELAADLENIALEAVEIPLETLEPTQDKNLTAPLICIWDGAEFGCELAAVMAQKRQVLVIDADLLNPRADLLLGLRKSDRSSAATAPAGLDQVLAQQQRGYLDLPQFKQLIQPSRIAGVDLLTSNAGLDHYEFYDLDSLHQVIHLARLISDLVLVLCSKFVYDAFTCLCLQAATRVLIPLPGESGSFRERRRSIEYLMDRQHLDCAKLDYAIMPYNSFLDLSLGTLDEMSGGRLVGCISESNRRRSMKSGAKPYAADLDRQNLREYRSLIHKLRLPELDRKAVV